MPEVHEAANIFPMDEEHLPELAEDIEANGLVVPIELYHGKVIDGRRRLKACEMAGVEPKFKDVNPVDPIAYAWSLNGPRRHLTPSDLAMVGGRMREMYDRAAKERKREAAVRGNKTRHGKEPPVPENLPEPAGDSRDTVGKTVGVSGKMIDFATKVLKHGVPELVKAVDRREMTVSAAATIAAKPPEQQKKEVSRPKETRKPGAANRREPDPEPEEHVPITKRISLGEIHAEEAIICLSRIPKNDRSRSRGFQIVRDWLRDNE